MGTIMITHSLADLDALSSEEDRAKARGFVERCAITVMGGLPPRELARVCEITPLTGPEQELVTSWSAPDSWQPGAKHPGRGQIPHQDGGKARHPGRAVAWSAPNTTSTTLTRPSAPQPRQPGPRPPLLQQSWRPSMSSETPRLPHGLSHGGC